MASLSHRPADRRSLRVSDAEREAVVDLLRDHCAEGRLTPDELADRIGAAQAARTFADLDELTSDLPKPRRARNDELRDEIARALAAGWRVEWHSDEGAVLMRGKRPNHVLHAVLTLVTGGIWAIAWIAIAIEARERRMLVGLDDAGKVYRERID